MISTPSSELLASKPRDSILKREQNSRYEHDNGLSTCWTQRQLSVTQGVGSHIRQRLAVDTRGGSRMRESRTYGSGGGGARGNSRPYREAWPMTAPGTKEARYGGQIPRLPHRNIASRFTSINGYWRACLDLSL
jgi:hypothetical protein